MECQRCHEEIPNGSKFCPTCGMVAAVSPPASCPNCGGPVGSGQQFCTSCGKPIVPVVAPPNVPPVSSPPPQPWQQQAHIPPQGQPPGGITPVAYWLPFVLLLLAGALFFYLGNVSIVGWAVLVVCFLALLLVRPWLLRSGALLSVGAWIGALVVLFLTLGITAPSKDVVGAAGSKAPAPTTAPQAASSVKVQNLATGTGLDNTQKITGATNVFRPNTEEICLSAEVPPISQQTSVDIQMTFMPTGDSIKGPTQKLEPAQGISRVGFAFSRPTNGWPPGQYKATFYLNGGEAGSTNFSVQQ